MKCKTQAWSAEKSAMMQRQTSSYCLTYHDDQIKGRLVESAAFTGQNKHSWFWYETPEVETNWKT